MPQPEKNTRASASRMIRATISDRLSGNRQIGERLPLIGETYFAEPRCAAPERFLGVMGIR
jgi:hypothetical protein